MDIINSLIRSSNITFFFHAFISLFVIVNAIGNVPVFVTILERFTEPQKNSMIKRASIIAMLSLIIVAVTGNLLFRLLGVEMFSFRIAGGILLLVISVEMLLGQKTRTQSSKADEETTVEMDDITVVPLAIPLLTGPGALTTGIVLFDTAHSFLQKGLLIVAMILVFVVSYIILLKSKPILLFLGKTGTRVARRIMGLMLMSIAVQFILHGIFEAVRLHKG
jgi:multiple antibiotic resistance protein